MTIARFESGTSPLALALRRFAAHLAERGYSPLTQEHYLSFARGFARFAVERRIELRDLRGEHVEDFVAATTSGRRWSDGGQDARRDRRNPLTKLLGFLRDEGVLPPAPPVEEALGPGLADYLAFARGHLGHGERTIARRRLYLSRFLTEIGARSEDDLRRITVEQVDRHLVAASQRLGRETMGAVSSSLRGFLGFLYMRGTLPSDLRAHVTTARLHKLARMPRAVAWSEIERTLSSIDRSTTLGCRDYAILTLIAYCGLRAGDVSALRLEDLDWRRDVIHARRPKTSAGEDVPLTEVVGEALIAYLRVRPAAHHDEVFLTVNAPPRPLLGPCISWRAAGYLRRAGVKSPKLGSHTLRHSFAVELLRQGHSLKEIGDVLGHTHPQSTYIYAKADVEQLRQVVLDIDPVLPPDFPSPKTDLRELRTVCLDIGTVLP